MPRAKQQRNVVQARELRRAMSLPEVLLWAQLRQADSVKFRRQHPIGPYVLDFYCARAKVCVEIDGIAHNMGNHPARDAARVSWLADQTIEVVRIPAVDVLRNVGEIADALLRYCRSK